MTQRNTNASLMWVYSLVLILALGVLGFGIYLMVAKADRVVLAAGCTSVIAVLLVWLMTANLRNARQGGLERLENQIAPLQQRLEQVNTLLTRIADQQLISERAKALAFRDRDREALRRAIQEETARRDFDAALVLAGEMEEIFGYRLEADSIRADINALQQADIRQQVAAGVEAIDRHCRGEQWTLALREAERLMRLYPDDEQVQKLSQQIEERRQNLKRQLIESWHEAVARHDVDGSIEILRQLDLYLTPAEAESMQDKARQVFKDKIVLLGQQFTQAVKDHNWKQAIRHGESIMNEFPNSRMAQEVREKIELLRQRAAEAETAKA